MIDFDFRNWDKQVKNGQTFWNNNHPLTPLADRVHELIPLLGEVENPRKNRRLEKFRKAANCYHDLFNNGLGNRAAEFRQVMGVSGSVVRPQQLEDIMAKYLIEAALEQDVVSGHDFTIDGGTDNE